MLTLQKIFKLNDFPVKETYTKIHRTSIRKQLNIASGSDRAGDEFDEFVTIEEVQNDVLYRVWRTNGPRELWQRWTS